MLVSFSFGPISDKLISTISESVDNIEFSSYKSIPEMIRTSEMAHVFFDRIVFSEKIINNLQQDLESLNDYIKEYSSNTQVVFICNVGGKASADVFNSIFNSPLYTPVLVQKVTTSVLVEFVQSDILELKTRYYTMSENTQKGVTSKSKKPVPQKPNKVDETQAKKGLFGGLFGGKKKKSQNNQNENVMQEVAQGTAKAVEMVADNSLKDVAETASTVASNIVAGGAIASGFKNEGEGNFSSNDSFLGSVGDQNMDFNNEEIPNEDDFLGLGGFGEVHSDTGFLDEEEENNILEELAESQDQEDNNSWSNNPWDNEENDLGKEENNVSVQTGNVALLNLNLGSGNHLLISERGIGCTTSIVDSSVNLVSDGNKVLIVDLDYRNNGVLSFIDTKAFYREKCAKRGKFRIYSEDGVDIASVGYGYTVSMVDVARLVLSGVFDKYDVVYIDCPLDCLDVLDLSLIERTTGVIFINENIGSILAMVRSLTDRRYVSPEVEDSLYNICDVQYSKKGYDEDINLARDICFFSRNDWLTML